MPPGILAEKMLMSLLTKEMHDNDEFPFSVKRVDVYEDVEHKIDFVVTVEGKGRGVKVGTEEHIGIQFTTNPKATERKTEQLERIRKTSMHHAHVDEIVLITLPLNDVKAKFDEWYAAGQKRLDPRGPDHLWDEATKQTIINGLVKGVTVHE